MTRLLAIVSLVVTAIITVFSAGSRSGVSSERREALEKDVDYASDLSDAVSVDRGMRVERDHAEDGRGYRD